MPRGVFDYPRDRRRLICQKLGVPGVFAIPEYRVWIGMRRRCNSPHREQFRHYGGRGIKVCERWENFDNFYEDMGPRPSSLHTIDRYPDTNGDYEPTNCRWAAPIEQANNKRSNRMVLYRGEQMSLRSAIRLAGDLVRKDAARRRLALGWSIERTVETPPDPLYQKHSRRAFNAPA